MDRIPLVDLGLPPHLDTLHHRFLFNWVVNDLRRGVLTEADLALLIEAVLTFVHQHPVGAP